MLDHRQIPATPEALDAAYLTRVLGCDVRAVYCEPIGHDLGFTGGRVLRLHLHYAAGQKDGPQSIIAKLAPPDLDMRRSFSHLGRNEWQFYTRFARNVGPDAPKCYLAEFDPARGDSLFLLEDLGVPSGSGFVGGGSKAQAEAVTDALARVHASFWRCPELAEDKAEDQLRGFDVTAAFRAYPRCVKGLLPDTQVPQCFLDLCACLAEAAEMLRDLRQNGPHTLVHRDLHLDNLAFRPDGSAVLLDWQFMGGGRGAFDLAYFLISSFEPDVRRAIERRLLRRYHAALSSYGVRGYAFETCWRDYKLGVFDKICMTAIATVYFENDAPYKTAWRAADLRRLLAFCHDHDVTPAVLHHTA